MSKVGGLAAKAAPFLGKMAGAAMDPNAGKPPPPPIPLKKCPRPKEPEPHPPAPPKPPTFSLPEKPPTEHYQ